jgi:hypothetical protein
MWLGHHSAALTLATYVHLLPDDLPDPAFLDELTAPSKPGEAEAGGEAGQRAATSALSAAPSAAWPKGEPLSSAY